MVSEEPENTSRNAKELVGHNQCASESEEQVEKLQPIPAFVLQGKTRHAYKIIDQNILQWLLNSNTRIL